MAFCHLMWIFMHPRVGIPYIVNTIIGKLSLIHEEDVRKNV
jgi:hypothetical protein